MLLWMAYRNLPTLFRMVPSPTPYGLPFLEIGGLQLSYLLPLISGTGKAIRTSNLAGTFIGPIRIKAHSKFYFRENGAWCIHRDCPNFLGRPTPIISGTGKGTDFKFCRNIHRVHRSMKNVGNSRLAVGVVRSPENF